ncbi:MAG: hypothetical protein WCD79_13930 [Chthoniobacteraceae bacterium]
MSLLPRAFYVAIGAVFGFIFVSLYFAWHMHEKTYPRLKVQEQIEPKLKRPLKTEDLVGTWYGEESDGETYNIDRNPDGTFTKFLNRVVTAPYIVKSKGYWSIWGLQYSYYETESTDMLVDHHPLTFTISDFKHGELHYQMDAGNWTTERKQ